MQLFYKLYNKSIEIFARETNIAAELTRLQAQYPDVEIGRYPFYDRAVFGASIVLNSYNEKHLIEVYSKLEKLAQNIT